MEKECVESVASPTIENGSQDKSKLCISIKYNTALPSYVLKNISLSEETRLQDKCINTKLYTVVLYI